MEIYRRQIFNYLCFFLFFGIFEFIKSVQYSTECKVGFYYDPNIYECKECPENMVPSKDGLSCICNSESYYAYNNITLFDTPRNSNVTLTSSVCRKCPKVI